MRAIMRKKTLLSAVAIGLGAWPAAAIAEGIIDNIETLVVVYAENRSFDNLYGFFPGANGLQRVSPADALQRDRDGSPLRELPLIWDGLTAKGVTPSITQAQ